MAAGPGKAGSDMMWTASLSEVLDGEAKTVCVLTGDGLKTVAELAVDSDTSLLL